MRKFPTELFNLKDAQLSGPAKSATMEIGLERFSLQQICRES